jgi:hypothetical protein
MSAATDRAEWLDGLKPGDKVAVTTVGIYEPRASVRVIDRLTPTTIIVSVGGYAIRQARFRRVDGIEITSASHRDEIHPVDSSLILTMLARQEYAALCAKAETRLRERRQSRGPLSPAELRDDLAAVEADLAKAKAALNEWESRYA